MLRCMQKLSSVALFLFLITNYTYAGTITVNSTADATARGNDITLREAIMLSEGSLDFSTLTPDEQAQVSTPVGRGTADTINFGISGTISTTSSLPTITDNETVIDASSQWVGEWPGGQPGVILDGDWNSVGLHISGAYKCHVRGLFITEFVKGILINDSAKSNTIGGTDTGNRNVISGNGDFGVAIDDIGADNNIVSGNYIGADVTGTVALGNTAGIIIEGRSNIIGGTTAAERNIISGNNETGISISGDNNVVKGNYIGIDVTGTVALGNLWDGFYIHDGAQFNTIGGTTAAERNIISGNARNGGILDVSANNVVSGNYIGTDFTGTTKLGNEWLGIMIYWGAKSNTIGGTTAGERNIISGNGDGVYIGDSGTESNVVIGNFIGTDVTGTRGLGNESEGVYIKEDAQSNIIGRVGAGNTIAFNDGNGILIEGGNTSFNTISGNSIHDNAELGIELRWGGNDEIEPPNVTLVSLAGDTLTVSGDAAGADAAVEVFGADSSGQEGQIYLGSLTADESGEFSGSLSVAGKDLSVGARIVATTTHTDGNTSEFSSPFTVALDSVPAHDWTIVYDGSVLPEDADPPWYIEIATGLASTDGDILTVNTIGAGCREQQYIMGGITDSPAGITVEARVKIGAIGNEGNVPDTAIEIRVSTQHFILAFLEDRILEGKVDAPLDELDNYHLMNTTSDFHVYRITIQNGIGNVYVDGVHRLTLAGSEGGGSMVVFGEVMMSCGGMNGLSYWDYVKIDADIAEPVDSTVPDTSCVYVKNDDVKVDDQGYIMSWLFLHPCIRDDVDEATSAAKDYFIDQGGEASIRPKEGDRVIVAETSSEHVWTRVNFADMEDMGQITTAVGVAYGRSNLDIACWGPKESVDNAQEYLVTYLKWDTDTTVRFIMGSDDASELYFNGEWLIYSPTDKPWTPGNAGSGEASVKGGEWNVLVVGVYEASDAWGISVRVDPVPDEVNNVEPLEPLAPLVPPPDLTSLDVAIFYDPGLPEQSISGVPEFAYLLLKELKKENLSAGIVDSQELAEYMIANPTGIMLIAQGMAPGTIFQNRGPDDLIYSWLRGGGIGGFVGEQPFFYWDNVYNVAEGDGLRKIFGVDFSGGDPPVTVKPTELGRKYIPSLLDERTTNRPVRLEVLKANGFVFESYADDGTYADPISLRTQDMKGWFINFHTSCCGNDRLPPFGQMAREYAELISNRFTGELVINLDQPASGAIAPQGKPLEISWIGSGRTALSVSLRIDDDGVWGNGGSVEAWIAIDQPVGGSYSWDTTKVPMGTYYITAVLTDGENEVYDVTSVELAQGVTADFGATSVVGASALTISFTDSSQGNPASWLWDFGDGETSDVQDPIHTYAKSGMYQVSLTVKNRAGSDTMTRLHNVSDSPCKNLLIAAEERPFDRIMREDKTPGVVYLSLIGGDTPTPNACGLNPKNDPDEWSGYLPAETDNATICEGPGTRNFIIMGGILFERGISSHSVASLVYDLTGGDYTRFECYVGLPDKQTLAECGDGSVDFTFTVDGKVMAETDVIGTGYTDGRSSAPTRVVFDIPPEAKEFTVSIGDAGDGYGCDHVCLGDAKLIGTLPGTRALTIDSVELMPGASATVQISISDITGVASGDIVIKYDASVITVDDVRATDLISGITLVVNVDVPGEIRLSMAGAIGMPSGSGPIIEIDLTANASALGGTETTLSFHEAEIYDELGEVIPVTPINGVVSIAEPGIKGDVNNDGAIRSNDATMTLRIAAGLMTPTEYQLWAADMNDDGKVRSNDATLILRTVAGLAAPGKDIIANVGRLITVTLSEAHGTAGGRIKVPVRVDNADVLASGDICIVYDPAVLRATDVLSDPDVLLVSNASGPGVVRIAFASTSGLSSQTVAEVQFDVLADGISPLSFRTVELYNPDALPLIPVCEDREFISWAMAPERSALLQNFPNPFNPETWIPYQLREDSEVTLRIYSVAGELVRELDLGYVPAGVYVSPDRAAHWDGRNETGEQVSSGVYFYSIESGGFRAVKKLIIAR